DILTGDVTGAQPLQQNSGDGADLFVLGTAVKAYYQGLGHATITDFYALEGDRFKVHGSIDDYSLSFQNVSGTSASDTLIRYQNDLIGVVQDTTSVALTQDFVFV
ncbi:MAG: hypothetical protein WBA10_12915, partial [Elainellaceae cyanobacterium]